MKKNIFLDLDNTLISAEPLEDIQDPIKFQERASKFDFKVMEDLYLICARPKLQPFLDFLFKNFNVNVWTAASKDYALFIIDEFILKKDTTRKINFILFDHHCRVSKKIYKKSKKLEMLWESHKLTEFDRRNTFIIDDLEEVYESQPKNCFPVKPFFFLDRDGEFDQELLKLKSKLTNTLL
ncbi:Haloacid dehalogenase-like hydrolases [Armadillidium vulgare iridescent virus]|jgi:TFIIF-interacting CTD phosphatase-like protein|uniref:Haloacid dehalogenase-like hydrolases n=1 Tax=Armadillidium vulgare iridescent virus TaxID=72201 RepID=A0A068QL29_9VIRU|nr:Haloacid dehalogenase-like hydrolases [Armadillidium vulgare iridescent virus]CCV02410.1 Haloacid dehalogenase-like hydrolases [Armadillidium vulgare iridescent virus]